MNRDKCLVYTILAMLLLSECVAPPTPVPSVEAELIDILHAQYPGKGLARPVRDLESSALVVYLSMYIDSFEDLDDMAGTVELVGWVVARWTDQNMRWDPNEYSGITKVPLRAAKVWLPPVIQFNYATDSIESIFAEGGTNSLSTVWVNANGSARAVHSGSLITNCDVDLSLFPFDSQSCTFLYTTIDYTSEQLRFETGDLGFTSDVRDTTAVWIISNRSCTPLNRPMIGNENYSAVACTFVFTRRSDWYIMNFFVPCLLFSVLQLATFFMPHGDSRATFCMTLALAFGVFQTLAATLLPKTSSPIPMVDYILGQMGVGIVATLNAIFMSYMYDTSLARERDVPKYLMWILWLYKVHKEDEKVNEEIAELEVMIQKRQNQGIVSNTAGIPMSEVPIPKANPSDSTRVSSNAESEFYSETLKLVKLLAGRRLRKLKAARLEQQWITIARFFDTCVGMLCLLGTIISIIYFFIS